MTTQTVSHTWLASSGANARIWMHGTKDLLIAAGLVQTTDTGQLAVGMPTATPVANANTGFHVFRFPDTLQSTKPIFIRLNYGTDGANKPTIWAQVGTSTDGAGVIGEPLAGSSKGAMDTTFKTGITSYACYTDGTFTMALGHGHLTSGVDNNTVCTLVVDRARTSAGVALGDGLLVEAGPNPGAQYSSSRSIYGTTPPNPSNNVPSLVADPEATGSADGLNVNVFRHYMMVPGVRPAVGVLTYFDGEFAALTPLTVTVLGSSHTYLPLGVGANWWSNSSKAIHCAAIRWE